jgi:putative ABC transport system ATP-binding protein
MTSPDSISNAAVALEDVSFGWKPDSPVLSIAALKIERGERVFIEGPSGSGKSTLLGLIGGVLLPRQGSLRVLGQDLSAMSGSQRDQFRARHIGFIFQMFNLIPYLAVGANVTLPLQFSPARREGLAGASPAAEATRLLAALGLHDPALLGRPVTQLSIGQQQRVAAARALIGRPQIVIADEPTSSLDADSRADFLRLLMSECAVNRTTLLFVSHDTALSSQFDRTLRMRDLNAIRRLEQAA